MSRLPFDPVQRLIRTALAQKPGLPVEVIADTLEVPVTEIPKPPFSRRALRNPAEIEARARSLRNAKQGAQLIRLVMDALSRPKVVIPAPPSRRLKCRSCPWTTGIQRWSELHRHVRLRHGTRESRWLARASEPVPSDPQRESE